MRKSGGSLRRRLKVAVVVVLVLCNVSSMLTVAQPGFLSLDCGGVRPYTDANGISWVPDGGEYVRTGSVARVNSAGGPQLGTLREFPGAAERKNCYTVPSRPGTRYLLRASFFYGNYDGAVTNPVFGLSLDATSWAIIRIANSTQTYFEEIVALSQSPAFAVCLLNTNQGTPFISSLEVRPLVGDMYGLPYMNQAYLLSRLRINFGAPSAASVRYPADPMDRIWLSDQAALGQGALQSLAPDVGSLSTTNSVDVRGAANRPPESVMKTAVVGLSGRLAYRTALMGFPKQAYPVTYFAELENLTPNEFRSFTMSVNANNPAFVGQPLDIQKEAGGPYKSYELGYVNVTFPEVLSFSLNENANSTHNPIVNALEIYELVTKVPSTDARDVSAVAGFVRKMPPEKSQGDPCLPLPWSWLVCKGGSPPRVTSIDLSQRNISGQIPSVLSSMVGLQSIRLDSNLLTGPIPDLSTLTGLQILHLQSNHLSGNFPQWLASLPNLKELWVENNNLGGTVPQSLLNKPELSFKFWGNPHLCANVSCSPPGLLRPRANATLLGVMLAGAVSAAVLVVAAVAALMFHRRIRQNITGSAKTSLIEVAASTTDTTSDGCTSVGESLPPDQAQNFLLVELRDATKNFTTMIGEGGHGSVFYGRTKDGHEIAVKVLAGDSCQGAPAFLNQVSTLSRVHHRNLVELIGICKEAKERVVVYEYMPKGPLFDHLHGSSSIVEPLDWLTRLNIALDAAKGLEYLHTGCNPSIIHGDVNSSNIFLTNTMVAKVSGFGLSTGARWSATQGAPGYLDPECYQSWQLTLKSDVYSFGVVLLELISGHEPFSRKRQDVSLVNWARVLLQRGDLDGIVDPALGQDYCLEAMWKFAELAILSVEPFGYHRPDMRKIVKEITNVIQVESMGKASSPSQLLPRKAP